MGEPPAAQAPEGCLGVKVTPGSARGAVHTGLSNETPAPQAPERIMPSGYRHVRTDYNGEPPPRRTVGPLNDSTRHPPGFHHNHVIATLHPQAAATGLREEVASTTSLLQEEFVQLLISLPRNNI